MSTDQHLRFLWIDDNPSRAGQAEALESQEDVEVSFEGVKGKDLQEVLGRLLNKPRPHLVILDHVLDKTCSAEFLRTGSTLAEIIRDRWPECPVVGITAARKRSDITLRQQRLYDELYRGDSFSDRFPCLLSLARGYGRVAEVAGRKRDLGVLELLEAPDEDRVPLSRALPEGHRKTGAGLPSRLYAWFRDVLSGRPGFLYDRLWTATLMGLNEDGFAVVEDRFADAKYQGVFACSCSDHARWWASGVKETLYRILSPADQVLPWELGRRLPGVERAHFSRCSATRKTNPPPETVAFLDATGADRRPMRMESTVRHPNFPALPFFEEIRMMGDEGER